MVWCDKYYIEYRAKPFYVVVMEEIEEIVYSTGMVAKRSAKCH